MVGEDVEELVDTVLAEVPSGLRDACDRVGILAGLQTAGALSVPMLTNMLAEDYAEVKAAIGTAAKPAFVATLKAATTARPATPATPQQAAFQTPQARGQTAAEPPPEAAVVTVKRGMVTLVTSRMIGLAASTTSAIACHAARLCQGVKTIDWPPQHNSTILYQDALRAQTAAVVIVHMRV